MTYDNSHDPYRIENSDEVFSPGLLIFRDLLESNLKEMIAIAGGPERLCPHCKTHKSREIIEIEKQLGIQHHKCATIAEAEMLARAEVNDVLIAYQMVGPNLKRVAQLIEQFPKTRFTTLLDHPDAASALSDCIAAAGKRINVLIDLNPGMDRTGIAPGHDALELIEMVSSLESLSLDGLHWYDGHHRQPDLYERRHAVDAGWNQFIQFRDQVLLNGFSINRIVAAGTGSFPILAEKSEPKLQLSPGTTVFFDASMVEMFPEMPYRPAIGIWTRVVSSNRRGEVTLDVGHKSCAADQPAGKRLWFPRFPDAIETKQTEEHLVIQADGVDALRLGDGLVAIPRHACPTSAVHQMAHVVSHNAVVDRWDITARDRVLTI